MARGKSREKEQSGRSANNVDDAPSRWPIELNREGRGVRGSVEKAAGSRDEKEGRVNQLMYGREAADLAEGGKLSNDMRRVDYGQY